MFQFNDIAPHVEGITADEKTKIEGRLKDIVPHGFQICGIPSGAKNVLSSLRSDDYLLLLESVGPGGAFAYGGKVVAALPGEHFELSQHLWGEARFSLIVFLNGRLTNYTWYQFCDAFGYKTNWNPAGNTYRLPSDRIYASQYSGELDFVTKMLGGPLDDGDASVSDFIVLDQIETNLETEEGREILRQHIVRERSASLIAKFKATRKPLKCEVCSFDFAVAYGDLGTGFIEAHHVKPLANMVPGDKTKLEDLVAVCSNCHRMLHRAYPSMSVGKLRTLAADRLSKSF